MIKGKGIEGPKPIIKEKPCRSILNCKEEASGCESCHDRIEKLIEFIEIHETELSEGQGMKKFLLIKVDYPYYCVGELKPLIYPIHLHKISECSLSLIRDKDPDYILKLKYLIARIIQISIEDKTLITPGDYSKLDKKGRNQYSLFFKYTFVLPQDRVDYYVFPQEDFDRFKVGGFRIARGE